MGEDWNLSNWCDRCCEATLCCNIPHKLKLAAGDHEYENRSDINVSLCFWGPHNNRAVLLLAVMTFCLSLIKIKLIKLNMMMLLVGFKKNFWKLLWFVCLLTLVVLQSKQLHC